MTVAGKTPPPKTDPARLALRLRRLWMGTLYIGVFAGYALLLGLLLVYHGWRPALLAVFLIGVMQLFRYVADDVDRIGWLLRREGSHGAQPAIDRHRARLQYLLSAVLVLLNLGLVYQAYRVSHTLQVVVLAMGLVVVEIMFREIRATNRQIDYLSPIYGMKHPGPITADRETTQVEAKLGRLAGMADRGEISRKAYEKTRDRVLVKRVMAE